MIWNNIRHKKFFFSNLWLKIILNLEKKLKSSPCVQPTISPLAVFKPLIIHNILQSIEIMADSSKAFALYCVKGIKADKKRIKDLLDNSLMLVTALAPRIGYDNAAKIAKSAHKNGTTLKEEVLKTGLISEKEYEKVMDPIKMTRPK